MGNASCSNAPVEPGKKVKPLVELLKAAGGVVKSPDAVANKDFLKELDDTFPELAIYKQGRIQTSPGVEDVGEFEEFGLECVSAGNRGPMSMDKVPGKFINLGNKKEDYNEFCRRAVCAVFLVVHDVGKSDGFRKVVNDSLPFDMRSDDHDRALACALSDPELKRKLLPTVAKLSPARQESILAGFGTNFQLPQLGQGANWVFVTLYFNFLYTNFKKSFPDFEVRFATMCESKVFCHETGLAVLRVLALTRNTYKNAEKVCELLLEDHHPLVQEPRRRKPKAPWVAARCRPGPSRCLVDLDSCSSNCDVGGWGTHR
eukprot:g21856.t1